MGDSGHLEEYADVLGDHPEFVAEIVEHFPVCYPLMELSVIRHEPDNRFLECALAADAEFIVTVNTAPGHFDRKRYQRSASRDPANFSRFRKWRDWGRTSFEAD